MKNIRSERHRLTTLQKQLMKWLKMEGGGVLPVDRLFNSMVSHHQTPDADPSLLGDRFCEAIDTMQRMGYTEVRLESGALKKQPSIYDFGRFGEQVVRKGKIFRWKKGECPVVALTDSGIRYADSL
jgi:hypothetical protein